MADYEAIIKAAREGGQPIRISEGVYAIVPDGSALKSLEQFLVNPTRARAKATAKSVETFVSYVNRFKDGPATVIFADVDAFKLIGIIDYHTPDVPYFGDHSISYAAPRSLEWQTWRGNSSKPMSQTEFAQFIENNVVDIHKPVGAEVLEVSRSLQAKKTVEFSSGLKLSDGSHDFTYSETVAGQTAKGKIKVPEEFTLGIPVFFGGESYEVIARLRYRIHEGKLSLWYELYRPEYIERDAFAKVCAEVAEGTEIEIWQGVP